MCSDEENIVSSVDEKDLGGGEAPAKVTQSFRHIFFATGVWQLK